MPPNGCSRCRTIGERKAGGWAVQSRTALPSLSRSPQRSFGKTTKRPTCASPVRRPPSFSTSSPSRNIYGCTCHGSPLVFLADTTIYIYLYTCLYVRMSVLTVSSDHHHPPYPRRHDGRMHALTEAPTWEELEKDRIHECNKPCTPPGRTVSGRVRPPSEVSKGCGASIGRWTSEGVCGGGGAEGRRGERCKRAESAPALQESLALRFFFLPFHFYLFYHSGPLVLRTVLRGNRSIFFSIHAASGGWR